MKTFTLSISDDHGDFHEVADDGEVMSEVEDRDHALSELKIFQPEIVSVDTAPPLSNEPAGLSFRATNGSGNSVAIAKRILRHKWTGLYFALGGRWVGDWRKATPISDPTNILATCKAHELPQIEFILKSETNEYDDTRARQEAAEAGNSRLFNERYGFEEFFGNGPRGPKKNRLFEAAVRQVFAGRVVESVSPAQIHR